MAGVPTGLPKAWPVSMCPMPFLFSPTYSLLSSPRPSLHPFPSFLFVSLPLYVFNLCLHQWCLQAKSPGLGTGEEVWPAEGIPAAARGTRTALAEEVPGGKPGFILKVLLTDAVKPGTFLSCSPGHIAFPFEVMIVFGPVLQGIYLGIKISNPFEKVHISFKPYLNQLVKTWNTSGQIRFIWNKEKYNNFGVIKLKVQCSPSWANWCLGKWGLDGFQRFPFLCWQSEKRDKRLLLVFVPKANDSW